MSGCKTICLCLVHMSEAEVEQKYVKDIEMIFATVLGFKVEFAGEVI